MKFSFPDIKKVFNTSENKINCLVIENQELFYELCCDLYSQINGHEGKSVLSIDDKPIDISKNLEMINQFVPFEINKKNLLTKLSQETEKIAISPENYEKSMVMISEMEKYFFEIMNDLEGSIECTKLTLSNLIKSVGLSFVDDYDSLCEKIVDYMELVRQYDKEKLFVFVNIRSYISDMECELFFDTIQQKLFNVIIIENTEHLLLHNEERYIIDKDLCEIS